MRYQIENHNFDDLGNHHQICNNTLPLACELHFPTDMAINKFRIVALSSTAIEAKIVVIWASILIHEFFFSFFFPVISSRSKILSRVMSKIKCTWRYP